MSLNISKFLNQFYSEAEEKLSEIQIKMVDFENNPKDMGALISVQRNIHTIKGSSRMVGLKIVSDLAHKLEDAFEAISSGRIKVTQKIMSILFSGIDTINEMISQKKKSDAYSDKLIATIDDIGLKIKDIFKQPITEAKTSDLKKNLTGGRKKKFNIDFNKLKKNINKKSSRSERISEQKTEGGKEADIKIKEKPKSLKEEKKEPEISDSHQKEYLKIEKKRIDIITNIVTDILTKKYLFSNLISDIQSIKNISENTTQEWANYNRIEFENINTQAQEKKNILSQGLDQINRSLSKTERMFASDINGFVASIKDLYDKLLELKLTPLSSIFNVYPRFVRDYAYRNSKKISVYLRGGDTEVDKILMEKINEPLIHLIRNSCDHGIETPEERKKLGKPEHGTIIIEAIKKGNRVEIKISDDGRGLNKDKIIKNALEKGMITEDKIKDLDDSEIYNIIFEPGFSTSAVVSDTSGRGIGMNIVKKVLHNFGGSIHIETVEKKSTTFVLEFPISIFTNSVMFIEEEGKKYAIPSNLIKKIVKIKSENIKERSGYSIVVYKENIFTVAKLNQILFGDSSGINKDQLFFIIPRATEKKIGIIVDNILFESNVIIKETGSFLGKLKYIYGLLIGNRGDIVSVLDIFDLIESSEFSKKIKMISRPKEKVKTEKKILIVDDSILVREMEKNLLEGAGYKVTTGINGLDGYDKAISEPFDLIVADIEMPEMDGLEMIENIKKIENYADIPTIVLSTVDKEEYKIRGLKVGANAWLQKQNFDDREFLKVIKSFIG